MAHFQLPSTPDLPEASVETAFEVFRSGPAIAHPTSHLHRPDGLVRPASRRIARSDNHIRETGRMPDHGLTSANAHPFPDLLSADDVRRSLSDPHAPVRHIPAGLDESFCRRAVSAADTLTYSAYDKTADSEDYSPILKVGPTVFDYIGKPIDPYLDEAAESAHQMRAAFTAAGVPHPLDLALDYFASTWDGEVAIAQEGGRPYFAGVLRDMAGGALPHVDHARKETPELTIGRTISQASLLFYLQAPSSGGALRVYDKAPTDVDDERHRLGYGYGPAAIAGATFSGVTPATGSVVLFPSTRIHSVDPVTGTGRRVTWSVFLGVTPEGTLLLWS
ncbi:2OG-Fe(II) oxygenase [Rhodococcus sp. A5(2022)]|uniref:2OG-Fe(II) oxygenase n=1 Tax=Rhodococcus sp. A5(2022) TaxID=3003588 RepID=UPI0022A85294|nr:2OG-Fe(II) oxygenase [Rhodococcus sp. A5(2022)]MCZ1075269.1 2OG-Fe(II) oxygenase [Rhodococcus sp. A5(2022)]